MDNVISFKAISNKFLLKEEKPSKGERLNWVAEKLKDREELFPDLNKRVKDMLNNQ
jgi:hypothetical protein